MCWVRRSARHPPRFSVKWNGPSEPTRGRNRSNKRRKGAGKMTELTYTKAGDYLIPDIQLEEMEDRLLGKYGRMRRAYLEENNKLLYNHLTLTGKLFPHLWEVQETATARMKQLMEELLAADPAPDKKTRQMDWVRHMNALKAQAEEIVMAELINN
ncbi:TnpV protein [Clostridium porci]|uniref:TnpV protein n=2 Tax=Clostridia TaxID=186801 RepID=UPI002E273CA3